jgi:preprotein translocase subunit SecE
VFTYLRDVRGELSKVTWPKKEEVVRLTLLVFAVAAVVAAFVGGLDFSFTKLLEFVVTK